MSPISAEEHELLSFFEVEPTIGDKEQEWPYNDYSYCVTRGELSLVVSVAPYYRDVEVRLSSANGEIYGLTALAVEDLRYRRDFGVERLEIVLTPEEIIQIVINPSIVIEHRATFKDRE